ncbi:hypothetical protein ACFWBN_07265 [Streptomyces sp. NPDC059989]|uniref:hypothetical protein n=1 Tax=Streptomyces sp. NPDC059989 TaxID=3347026 RepID=UPI0036AF0438
MFWTAETGGWLVKVGHSDWPDDSNSPTTSTAHVRISVAELEHTVETPVAERPAKSRLRRALGRG